MCCIAINWDRLGASSEGFLVVVHQRSGKFHREFLFAFGMPTRRPKVPSFSWMCSDTLATKTKNDSVNFDSVPLIYVSFRFHFRTHTSISAIKLSISCTAQCSTIVRGFGTHGYAWSVAFSTPAAPLRQPSPLRPATARKHSPHTNPFAQPKPHPRDVPSGPFPITHLESCLARQKIIVC